MVDCEWCEGKKDCLSSALPTHGDGRVGPSVLCTREKRHPGNHVTCAGDQHAVAEWKDLRTPKAGETWIWLPCEKHEFKQLRDLVVSGVDHEDQPVWIQELELEHLRCGCRFHVDDPVAALVALRAHEAAQVADLKATITALSKHLPAQERSIPIGTVWLILAILYVLATTLYVFLHH